MKKIAQLISFFKKFIAFVFQPIVLFGGFYLLWLFFVPMDFKDNDPVIRIFSLGLFFLFLYALLEISAKLPINKWFAGVIKMLFAVIEAFIALSLIPYIAFINMYFVPILLIYIVFTILLVLRPLLKTIKAPRNKFQWINILTMFFAIPILFVNIAFLITFYPVKYDSAVYQDKEYFLISGRTFDDFGGFMNVYRCSGGLFSCTKLFSEWSLSPPDTIVVDSVKEEIHFVFEPYHRIYYTDGEGPRDYVRNSVITDNYLFTLSVENNCDDRDVCESDIYTLYRCELDYTLCTPLNVQFIDMNDDTSWMSLEYDEEQEQVNVYREDGDYNEVLVFTYGNEIQCFDDGCLIDK